MIRYLALVSVVVSCFSMSEIASALAKQTNKSYRIHYTAGHTMLKQKKDIISPEKKILSSTERDAEEAIFWQNSLHGEID